MKKKIKNIEKHTPGLRRDKRAIERTIPALSPPKVVNQVVNREVQLVHMNRACQVAKCHQFTPEITRHPAECVG